MEEDDDLVEDELIPSPANGVMGGDRVHVRANGEDPEVSENLVYEIIEFSSDIDSEMAFVSGPESVPEHLRASFWVQTIRLYPAAKDNWDKEEI